MCDRGANMLYNARFLIDFTIKSDGVISLSAETIASSDGFCGKGCSQGGGHMVLG